MEETGDFLMVMYQERDSKRKKTRRKCRKRTKLAAGSWLHTNWITQKGCQMKISLIRSHRGPNIYAQNASIK